MTIEILQLTDLHLISDPSARLKGVPTRDAFNEVLNFIKSQQTTDRWDFEQIIITGDLAHDEQFSTYELLRDLLGDWLPRCRLIPGNHDDRAAIRQVFGELVAAESDYACFSIQVANWRLIGLDSHLPGEVAGQVASDQLDWLAAELASHGDQPTIVFSHHPSFSVRSAWLDRIAIRNADQLLELVRNHPQVRALCTGHVHHEFRDQLGQIELLTTPATGVQFAPFQETPVCDPIPPGFRIFRLQPETFQTEVVRLPELTFPPQLGDS